MTTLLTSKKRMLTTYVNKLEHILNSLKNEKLEDTPWDPSLPQAIQMDNIHRLEEGVSVIELAIAKVERALHEFASLLDTNPLLATDQSDFEGYAGKSENILTVAFDYLLVVQARLRALKCAIHNPAPSLEEQTPNAPIGQAKVRSLDLPPIPIPTFGGNIWEWDNFWGIFNTIIHSQDLSNMVKYNYLLNALKGEARESIRKFQVTGENYTKAIQFLHNKYNNKEALVQVLVEKLDNCALRGPSVKDQRQLLEQLQMITTQLEEKGEDINSSWLVKKVLCKFPDSVRRKTIAKK
ncbi:hypothetical protein ANCCEY_10584 [Ancylostoma ceylanicum]|uniref:Uncharacterized protein n=1 Tax=Ancylostoma ceylanicum TaxID=53326 RepID=A0A0D6LK13_9BILA|nr:hypothetical protein ANCCEY_10584 [Ancylostoma ceylanicum]